MTTRQTPAAVSALLSAAFFVGCNRGSTSGDVPHTDNAANPSTSAGSSGEVKQPGTDETKSPAQAVHDETTNRGQQQGDNVPQQSGGTHVGRRTDEILNVKEVTKDPNWTVVAKDPQDVKGFTAAGTAYNRAAVLSGTVGLEQWVQHTKALEDRFPTYQELQTYMAQNHFDMPALREYHHYGYDESTGNVVILESKEEKEGRRKEIGLSPNE